MKFVSSAFVLLACTQVAVFAAPDRHRGFNGGNPNNNNGLNQQQCQATVTVTAAVTQTVTADGSAATNNAGSGSNDGTANVGTGNTGSTDTGNTGSTNTGSNTGSTNTGSNTGSTNTGSTNTGSNTGSTNTGSNTGSTNTGSNTGSTNTGSNTGSTNTGANTGSNNNNNAGANSTDEQSSLTLDPSVIGANIAQNGLATAEAGQSASLTSTDNFIGFCIGKTITNGEQVQAGSCNPIPMGDIPAKSSIPSAKFTSPANFATIPANQDFTVSMAIQNMVTGDFVNPETNYFGAPQSLVNGQITGHSHIVIEQVASLTDTAPTNPTVFAFFKGLNAPAQGGVLTADVAKGLPPGVFRIGSINTAANHQPVLAPVAQHGTLDDWIYVTVAANGAANSTAASAASGAAATDSAAAAGAAATDSAAAAGAATDSAAAAGAAATGAAGANAAGANAASLKVAPAQAKTAQAKTAQAATNVAKNAQAAAPATNAKTAAKTATGAKNRRFLLSRMA